MSPILSEQAVHHRNLCLTFDDFSPGHRNVVLPLLRRLGIPATFFVVTSDLVVTETRDDFLILNRMVREGHEIGNHSHTHRDLRALGEEELAMEIEGAKQLLEDELPGFQVSSYCLPFGVECARSARWVRQSHRNVRGFPEVGADYQGPELLIPVRVRSAPDPDRVLAELRGSQAAILSLVVHGVYSEKFPEDRERFDAVSEEELTRLLLSIRTELSEFSLVTMERARRDLAGGNS